MILAKLSFLGHIHKAANKKYGVSKISGISTLDKWSDDAYSMLLKKNT